MLSICIQTKSIVENCLVTKLYTLTVWKWEVFYIVCGVCPGDSLPTTRESQREHAMTRQGLCVSRSGTRGAELPAAARRPEPQTTYHTATWLATFIKRRTHTCETLVDNNISYCTDPFLLGERHYVCMRQTTDYGRSISVSVSTYSALILLISTVLLVCISLYTICALLRTAPFQKCTVCLVCVRMCLCVWVGVCTV